MVINIGDQVGPYIIKAKLGQGGMATVYKAYHEALDRYVAIKVMLQAYTADENFAARFQREARIVAKLEQTHIVPVYDYNQHEGMPYLVMKLIEGTTLKGYLREHQYSLQETYDLLANVGGALTYAHEQGVLHRDIKPSNIMLANEAHVPYLADFGLARIAQSGESTLSQDMMLGTPQYISPEQAQGIQDLDARTDIYSLGVVLYEMIVGQVPFVGDTPYAIIHNQIYSPLPAPRLIKPDMPAAVEQVLFKALAKEREDRYQSVNDMVVALDAAIRQDDDDAATVEIDDDPTFQLAIPTQPIATSPPQPSPAAAVPMPRKKQRRMRARLHRQRREQPQPRYGRLWMMSGVGSLLIILLLATFMVLRATAATIHGSTFGTVFSIEDMSSQMDEIDQDTRDRAVRYLYRQAALANPDQMSRLEAAFEEYDHLAAAHAIHARLLLETGDLEAAQEELNIAFGINADSPEAHLVQGLLFAYDDDLSGAAQEWRTVTSAPDTPTWIVEEAASLSRQFDVSIE